MPGSRGLLLPWLLLSALSPLLVDASGVSDPPGSKLEELDSLTVARVVAIFYGLAVTREAAVRPPEFEEGLFTNVSTRRAAARSGAHY